MTQRNGSKPERKYALSKIAAGDYLLPSNDGQTIWRLAQYTEGPSTGLDDWPSDRQVWGLWRWHKPAAEGTFVDTGGWDRWDFWEGLHDTRAEAVKAALDAG